MIARLLLLLVLSVGPDPKAVVLTAGDFPGKARTVSAHAMRLRALRRSPRAPHNPTAIAISGNFPCTRLHRYLACATAAGGIAETATMFAFLLATMFTISDASESTFAVSGH